VNTYKAFFKAAIVISTLIAINDFLLIGSAHSKFIEHFNDTSFYENWEISNFDIIGYSIDTSWFVIEDGYSDQNPDFSILSRCIEENSNFTLAIKSHWHNPGAQYYQLLYVRLIDTISSTRINYNLRSYHQGDNVIEYDIGIGFNTQDIPEEFTETIRISKKYNTIDLLWDDSIIASGSSGVNFNRLEIWIGQSKYYEFGEIGIDYINYINGCGDANWDGSLNILDVSFIINFLYRGGSSPDPLEAADANGNGAINILDISYLIDYLYKGGPEPICP